MSNPRPSPKKTRASTSEQAREYRQRGHDLALEFAKLLGLDADYKNDPQAKKDVVDLAGETYSVKGGVKKWQIFLYGKQRFKTDEIFKGINEIGQIFVDCINSFPTSFIEYEKNKEKYKKQLEPNMIKLANKLKEQRMLKAFISKAMFNAGEVKYLTVYHNYKFHIFWWAEVERILSEKLEVDNSRARTPRQFSNQKVIFRYNEVNLGELEMRNDSDIHYREIRFNMLKPKVMQMLFNNIKNKHEFHAKVIAYGDAVKPFRKSYK
jgi:hypothetical protein